MRMKAVIAILVPLLVGFVSGFATASSVDGWYATIVKPSFNPPNWIFAPVWTTLYILMGIASYLVWKQPATTQRNNALRLYGVQLFLNFWWSMLFFGLQSPGWAMIEIILLLASILATMLAFRKQSVLASWLLLPYLLWVSFATALNVAIWQLNS